MTISTLNGVIAGMQTVQNGTRTWGTPPSGGHLMDTWYNFGLNNASGAADTTINGVALSSSGGLIQGQIPHFDAPGGTSSYLARVSAYNSANAGYVYLCDRIWHNGGITTNSTSTQTIASPTFPARDNNGTSNGDGVLVGISVSAATGAGTPLAVLGYTNSTGASGRTANLLDPTAASSIQGMFYRFQLQQGDTGVQSVQSLTFTGPWASGTVNLVAYRVLALIGLGVVSFGYVLDPVTGGMPQIYNGAVPFMLSVSTNVGALLGFTYIETQG